LGNYLNTPDPEWYKGRLVGMMICMTAAFLVLFVRLFYLQVMEGEAYRRLSESNSIRLQHIDAPRGLIFDRNGEMLVDNRPSFDLGIITRDARPISETLARLSYHTRIPYDELKSKVDNAKKGNPYKPVILKADIGRDLLAAVEVHLFDLPGVNISVRPRRHYLQQQSAAHLLGYLGEINAKELKNPKYASYLSGELIGRFGVEKTYESYLSGQRGGRQVEMDARGRVVRVRDTIDADAGNNIYLTIDIKLQQRAEELLADRAGAVVAMDPNTGEILAMASNPAFDQNIFVGGLSQEQWDELISNPDRPMENKVLQAEYPPGSTYKIVSAMAGLGEGVIDRNTTFYCPGQYRFGDRTFHCWKKGGHGKVNVVKALTESCDVFFYQVGEKLGVDRLAWYATAGGLGARTGVDLDNEGRGLIPTAAWKKKRFGEPWYRGETLSIAIGQGFNLTTPIQLAVLTGAVANGGMRYQPHVFKEIRRVDGTVVRQSEPALVGRLPLDDRHLKTIQEGLWQVVNGPRGTAKVSKIKEVEMSGKTGTAQVFTRKTKEVEKEEDIADHLKSHAWFVAYAPFKDPEIAISVIVEHGAHGSSVASPIAKELVMTYMGIAPKETEPKESKPGEGGSTVAAAN
jgi:penicillin-binding protein 2